MERNSFLGFILIGIVLIIFFLPNKKKDDQVPEFPIDTNLVLTQDTLPDSSVVALSADTDILDSEIQTDSISEDYSKYPPVFHPFLEPRHQNIVLENELLKLVISSKGGMISYVELKNYRTYDSLPLVLFDSSDADIFLRFPFNNKLIETSNLYFSSTDVSASVKGNDSHSVSMFLYIDQEHYLENTFTMYGNSYMIKWESHLRGFDEILPNTTSYLELNWHTHIREQEKSIENEKNVTTVYYKYKDENPDHLSERKEQKQDLTGQIKWISFKQQFFNQTIISKDHFVRGYVESQNTDQPDHIKRLTGIITLPYEKKKDNTYEMQVFFGPNHYNTLKKYDLKMEKLVPLGWGIFGWVNKIIVIPVFHFLSAYIANYGIIILLLTIFIKMILLPFTYRSYKSTAKMKVLKPEIDAIKEKVGKDPAKLQTEQMKLYRRAGVSPLGGCLPMLLQMPILIAMFRFFPASIELRQESFLWASDLSTYDSIYDFPNGFSIPFYGDHVSLFTLLMTISTLIYTRMNSKMMGTGDAQKQMQIISYIMPVMFLGFFNSYASALSYYYFLANIITFGQQYIFKLTVDEAKLKAQIEMNKKKKANKGPSRWQKRLEDLQKNQQKRRR
jgi:YidC/Oxa1 family membrane protein insertase